MVKHRLLVAISSVFMLALSQRALSLPRQDAQPPDKAQQAPGFVPDRLYTEVLPTDHVDIFSGALVLSQPLWTAPQQGALSLQLTLHHSSTAGDARKWGGTQPSWDHDCDCTCRWRPWHEVNRVMDSWAGVGFEFSVGRLAKAAVREDEFAWHWIDESGAFHEMTKVTGFVPTLPAGVPQTWLPVAPVRPEGNDDTGGTGGTGVSNTAFTLISRDGTYIRADWIPSKGWFVYFPDGTLGQLGFDVNPRVDSDLWDVTPDHDAYRGGGYWLTRRFDRDFNVITVTYVDQGRAGAIQRIVDSVGRVIEFDLHESFAGPALAGYLQAMRAGSFGESETVTTFDHEPFRIFESLDGDASYPLERRTEEREIARLRAVHRPEDLTTSFEYRYLPADAPTEYSNCQLSCLVMDCGFGPLSRWTQVRAINYPLGGRVVYDYSGWLWEMEIEGSIGIDEYGYAPGQGIVAARKYTDGDESNTAASNVAEWLYRRGCDRVMNCQVVEGPCEDENGPLTCPAGGEWRDSCWGVVGVRGPDGNLTRHRFALDRLHAFGPPGPSRISGKELERWVFEADCEPGPGQHLQDHSCDGLDPCRGRAIQHVVTAWMQDWLDVSESGRTTWTLEEGDAGTSADDSWARTTTSRCDFDGFGHFRRETTTSTRSLTHEPRTSHVRYTPMPATWLLGTWDLARDQEGGVAVTGGARFDDHGRQVQRQGSVNFATADPALECPLSTSATFPVPGAPHDGLLVPSDNTSNSWDGLNWRPLTAAAEARQQAALPGAVGDQLTTIDWFVSGETALPGADIGKVQSVTQSLVGQATTARTDAYEWRFGALASKQRLGLEPQWYALRRAIDFYSGLPYFIRDPAGLATEYTFDAIGRITLIARPDEAPLVVTYPQADRAVTSIAADDGFSAEYYQFDGLGRLSVHERTTALGTLAFREFEYDPTGRKVREIRWQESGTNVAFLPDEDRPQAESWIETSYAFSSPRAGQVVDDALGRVRRVVAGPDTEVLSEYPLAGGTRTIRPGLNADPSAVSSSLAVTDGLGRLVSVTPDQPGGASATYAHDIFGELALATLTGEADGQPFTQLRKFVRDGLGRVTASVDPQGGTVETLAFDAEGRPLTTRDANAVAGGYVLSTDYDAAGRPLRLSRVAAGVPSELASWSYDGTGSSCPGTHDLGKLTGEKTPLPEFNGSYARCVQYSGLGGRPSRTRVALTLPSMPAWSFEQDFDYTDRGLVSTVGYPTGARQQRG